MQTIPQREPTPTPNIAGSWQFNNIILGLAAVNSKQIALESN